MGNLLGLGSLPGFDEDGVNVTFGVISIGSLHRISTIARLRVRLRLVTVATTVCLDPSSKLLGRHAIHVRWDL